MKYKKSTLTQLLNKANNIKNNYENKIKNNLFNQKLSKLFSSPNRNNSTLSGKSTKI